MSAVPKSSGDLISFSNTGLKVIGLRPGMADKLRFPSDDSECLYK